MLTDMAVTSDNKLLLCNVYDEKVYIYKDYKTYEDEISFTWYYSNTPRWTGKRYFIFIGFVILVYIYLLIINITK
jgi:hypothetical protein